MHQNCPSSTTGIIRQFAGKHEIVISEFCVGKLRAGLMEPASIFLECWSVDMSDWKCSLNATELLTSPAPGRGLYNMLGLIRHTVELFTLHRVLSHYDY